jgi:hypothetical protein
LALCSLENKDARARFGILKGLHSARRGRISVTTLRRISQNGEQSEQTARPGHTRGERSPPAPERPELRKRKRSEPRGAPEGLDSTTGHCPTPGSDEHRRDITGNDPKVTPSKRNSESSERFRRDRSVYGGLRRSSELQSSSHEGVKGGHPSAGVRERPSNQCSTG